MEGIVLALAALAPWLYGCVDPVFEYLLLIGVACLGLLWGARSVLDGQFLWFACPVALSLGLIFLLGALQLVPLPSWILTAISPATASLNSELRPQTPEVIVERQSPASSTPWPTISVYPAATRQWLNQFLAVVLLFAVVRVNIAKTESLRRLSWVAFGNGVALSVFALYQFVATHRAGTQSLRTVLGFETRGDVFGTFICRNHFAYYLNMCIGLSIGLLLVSGRTEGERRARFTHKAQALVEQTAEDEATLSLLSILHSPLQLWLMAGIAVMITAVVCSMSRGGVAALVIGVVGAMALRGFRGKRIARLELLIVPAVLLMGLVAWVGIKPLESRLNVTGASVAAEGRLEIWKNLLPVFFRFPFFGSGAGTLQYIEPLGRTRDYHGYNAVVDIDHAHNDYLEAIVEGGVLRLVFTLAIVYFLLSYGRKALHRHDVRTPGRLAFGALVGVIAVSVHNLADFGLYTPSVAWLAAVVAAQLCAMARSDPSQPLSQRSKHSVVVRMGGLGGAVAMLVFAALAGVLLHFGSTMTRVHDLRLQAFRALRKSQFYNPDLGIKSLAEAVRLAPDDANVRLELGQAILDVRQAKLKASATPPPPALFNSLAEEIIAARDLCPLLARAQARLAAFAFDAKPEGGQVLAKSDPAQAYWTRAVRLAPYDHDLLYYYGLSLFDAGKVDQALEAWHASLSRKPIHLANIVTKTLTKLSAKDAQARLLPDDPAVLLETARIFAQRPGDAAALASVLDRAQKLLNEQSQGYNPTAWYLTARCHRMKGETQPALAAYRQAIEMDPRQIDWMFDFAEYLSTLPSKREKQEALEQIKRVLDARPTHVPAHNLKLAIERDLSIR